MGKLIPDTEHFKKIDEIKKTFLRGTLKSLIEADFHTQDKKLISTIFPCGKRYAPIEYDPGHLLGDLLSFDIFFNSYYLKDGYKTDEMTLSLIESGDLIVAEFCIDEKRLDLSDPIQYLIYNWKEMYFSEFKTICFINDLLDYCQEHNLTLDFELLTYLMEMSDIHIPKAFTTIFEEGDDAYGSKWLKYECHSQYEHKKHFDICLEKQKDNKLKLYEMDSIPELAICLLYEIISRGHTLKKCQNCGKWFIPKKADEKYCSRLIGDKSCKEIAALNIRRKTYNSKPLQKQYNSINTMLANRLKRKGLTWEERMTYDRDLCDFRIDAKDYKSRVKDGTITEDEYLNWLNSFKKNNKQHKE